MIFEFSPSQIEGLDSKELVELLRRLLHYEALLAGIEMSAVAVPMQITVADGGEDARVQWEGGLEKTDHLPSRFTVFQSKASNPGKAGWMKEVWSKASRRAGTPARSKKKGAKSQRKRPPKPKLNDAVATVLAAQGAYIGFTSAAPSIGLHSHARFSLCSSTEAAKKNGIRR